MDDKMLLKAKENLARLDKQYAELTTKQRRVEKQLADEHDAVRKGASQRTALVAQLVDAAPEQAAKVHKQLDSIDAQIRGSERMAESYQALLRTIASETATITSERNKLNEVVGAEVNAREFALWQTAMTANFAAATLAMEAARLTLGRLNVAAAKGGERFAEAARSWAATRFDEFEHQQANPDTLLGFKLALPVYRSLLLHVAPMEKR